MITIPKAATGGLAVLAAGVLLVGCAAPPPETTTPSDEPVASDFLPCMVSDTGGFDDHSFNELGYNGIEQAAEELGVEFIPVESTSDTDFAPNLTSLIDQGCTYIVTVGFLLSAATVETALANPDIQFAIVDDAADNDFDGAVDADNIKPLIFDTAQAAFLAGYAAASYSADSGVNKVGTFGGMNIPTVSIFMDGFAQGVDYYNSEKGASVQVIGWDREAQDGTFTGDFVADDNAKQVAQGIVDQGVDVLLPVGGPIYQSGAAAIADSGREIALIGVDADVYLTDPSVAPLLLTSIEKLIDAAVYAAVTEAGTGGGTTEPYVGTLENGGVGLAPFHDFESKVSPDLQGELDAIAEGIIDGSIPVESYLAG